MSTLTDGRFLPVLAFTLFGAGWASAAARQTAEFEWWLAVSLLALVAVTGYLLVRELHRQACRGAGTAEARWTSTDTANGAILGGIAAFIGAAVAFGHAPTVERIAGVVVAVVYIALAVSYVLLRRQSVRRHATGAQ